MRRLAHLILAWGGRAERDQMEGTRMNGERPVFAKFPVCRLWTRPGRDGGTFLSGRWGNARVLVVPNPNPADGDDATHLLVLGEAEPANRKPKKEI